MSTENKPSLEDVVHEPGTGIPDRYLPERNPDTLTGSHALCNDLRQLLVGHRVRVILYGDFSKVAAAVQSDCFGWAGPADLENLARAALTVVGHGGYRVHLYPRDAFGDASVVVFPEEGKLPRTDVPLEECVRALSTPA